jgi:hypothetical protein
MDRGVWGWEEAVSAYKQNMKAKGFWNVPGGTDKVQGLGFGYEPKHELV